jgi:hypothetical protein
MDNNPENKVKEREINVTANTIISTTISKKSNLDIDSKTADI